MWRIACSSLIYRGTYLVNSCQRRHLWRLLVTQRSVKSKYLHQYATSKTQILHSSHTRFGILYYPESAKFLDFQLFSRHSTYTKAVSTPPCSSVGTTTSIISPWRKWTCMSAAAGSSSFWRVLSCIFSYWMLLLKQTRIEMNCSMFKRTCNDDALCVWNAPPLGKVFLRFWQEPTLGAKPFIAIPLNSKFTQTNFRTQSFTSSHKNHIES